MKTIYYRVLLDEQTILTAIEGEPNSAVSYDFIPGSVIRGFFIGEYMRQYNIRELNPADEGIRRQFFSNSTRYLNLYPVINDYRGLPAPSSWRRKKYGDDDVIYDEALYSGNRDGTDKFSSISGFVHYRPEYEQATVYKPLRVLNVHTQRARRSSNEQQIYRYDALAGDQTFAGMILCKDDADANLLYGLMENTQRIHLGGARSPGYGLAQIVEAIVSEEWKEIRHQLDSTVVLTLLSDLILRDEHGQYAPTLEALRLAFRRYSISFDYGDYVALQTTLVGGFNRKWGLPLPQTLALKRGGVLRLKNLDGNEEDLWQLVWDGIGERTNEGFGQVALNWQSSPVIRVIPIEILQRQIQERELTIDGTSMLRKFEARMAQPYYTPEIIHILFTDGQYKIMGEISPSQISRLRAQIADELRQPTPSLDFMHKFLDDVKDKIAGKQFENARIGGQSLNNWLANPPLNFVDEEQIIPTHQLQLIDVVLERAHKERTRKQKVRL